MLRLAAILLVCSTSLVAQAHTLLGHIDVPAQSLKVFGQNVVYYEAGRGTTLILLSNIGRDANDWFPNFKPLSERFHVVALDLIGIGRSDKPMIEYKMRTWTENIAEFMHLKKIPKAIVGGAVMGGALGVQFALDYPGLSAGVLVAASNSGPGKHEGSVSWSSDMASMTELREHWHQAVFDPALVTDDFVRASWEARLRANDGYVMARHFADHRSPYSEEELGRISVPALFVWCREDRITPLPWGEQFAASVKGAKLTTLDQCGHFPNLERPQQFNSAVIAFFGSSRP